MTGKKSMASKNGFVGKRGYGWVPDVPDQRDYLLSAVLKVPARLPDKVDLRDGHGGRWCGEFRERERGGYTRKEQWMLDMGTK